MALILSGSDGLSDVDGSAATPAIRGTDANTGIFFPAADTIAFSEGGVEAARFDSSGRLGIGTTSPDSKLVVEGSSGTYVQVKDGTVNTFIQARTADSTGVVGTITNHALAFFTSSTECARITSAGVLLVGVTATGGGGSHLIQAGTGVNSLQMQNNSTTLPYGPYINFSQLAPNNTGNYFMACGDTGTTRMLLYANGGIANYSANNVNLSDRREKTNFAPAKSYLDVICSIPVQTFNYIDQNLEEDDGLTLGVVAQDVQAVAPELVKETNWADKGQEPKMRLSIYQTDLQYALMKCIQEQQAIITQLQADVAALKAK